MMLTLSTKLPSTDGDIQHVDIKNECIRFLYQGAGIAIAVNFFIAILTVWILWGRVDHQPLLNWFGLLVAITVLRAIGAYKFRKKSDSTQNIQFWYYLFLVKSTLSGLVWGMSIWFFSPFSEVITPVLIVFVLGGLTAGAAAVLGSVLTVYYSYIVAIMLPITIWFNMQPSQTYSVMSLMLTVYILTMMMAGYLYRKVLIRSITLSNDLVEAKNHAEEANKAKPKFLSSMSHELRTPLNAILGFAQLLNLDAKSLDKEQRESVNYILNSGQHLLELVNDVLELSKIEAGNIQIAIENVNLNDVLTECISLVQGEAITREITFNNKIGNEDIIVQADRTKLKQVFINLLSNAIKYNRFGGSITLSYDNSEDDHIRIYISDTGKGIAKEQQEKLFTPFERLGHENSNIDGNGIGLVVSRQIMEAMGGPIGFNSEEGKGTTFWVQLPFASA